MDTKWNNTTELAETAPLKKERKQHPKLRAGAAFLAFLLGVSLTLGSLGGAIGRVALGYDTDQWWTEDWQETPAFRAQVSEYLRKFLELGAGRTVSWENWAYDEAVSDLTGTSYEVLNEVDISTYGDWAVIDRATTATESAPTRSDLSPDAAYQKDKNILYFIETAKGKSYDNLTGVTAVGGLTDYRKLPDGYNFLLVYENGKVSIWKDGAALDVYGNNRIYNEDALWCVPGYDNFKADDDLKDVVVKFAVRETPVRYLNTDPYSSSYSAMYWLYQDLLNSRQIWAQLAVCCSAGILLLAVWFVLRKDRKMADAKIAAVTAYIPTEVRFLAVALCLVGLLLPMLAQLSGNWYGWWNAYDPNALTSWFLRAVCAVLANTGALLGLIWSVWFIRNDHRYHSKEQRRSLVRMATGALRKHELRYPIQKRLDRRTWVRFLLLILCAPISIFAALLSDFFVYGIAFPFGCGVYVLLLLLLFLVWGRRDRALARDFGLLADQVTAIQSGELSIPIDLPEDADLRQTAEQLNAIQSGLKAAVAEQTRSERMKVELISNVSHDLKTPLTSILSYSELLMQEDLDGAAADYAKIIQQKSLRLKSMVQDVFEISKAASDQLPVKPEKLDFTKLLRQTLADMDTDIQQSGLTFKLDLPDTPVEIVADGGRLYRVFQNLIQNALKYSLPGSRVHLSLKAADKTATASLRNTSRNELPEGVDFTARFVRGDESRTDGGTGLGLSVAKSFTEACGGSFRVETVADLFTAMVTFPLAEN